MPLTFSWTVQSSGPAAPGSSALSAGQGTITPRRQRRGLLWPLQRDGAGRLAMTTGEELDQSQLAQLLGADVGPAWNADLCAGLDRVRNTKNNQVLSDFASVLIRRKIQKYMPHLLTLSVTATRTARSLDLVIKVQRIAELGTGAPRIYTAKASLPNG